MTPAPLSKKKAFKSQKAPPKKKQKNELLFNLKVADVNDDEVSDHSDGEDEPAYDSGSASEGSSDGDNPLTDDFLQGSDDEGMLFPLASFRIAAVFFFS